MDTVDRKSVALAGIGVPALAEARAVQVALAGLIALAVAMGIGRFAFTPVLPMMKDAGLSIAAGGLLASANYVGYLLGSLLAVVIGMRPAWAIRAGLLAIVVSTAAMGMTEDFAAWALLRAVAGVASAFVLVFCSTWCMERLAALGKPSLGGVAFGGVGAGIMAAGVICLVLVRLDAGPVRAWWSLGLVAALLTAVVWNSFSGPERRASAAKSGEMDRAPAWDLDALRLVACYGAFGFGYIIPATFLPVMAKRLIADAALVGWAWPVFGLAAALATLFAARLRVSVRDRDLWAASHFVMAAGVAAPAIWHGIAAILAAALCVGGTTMVITMAGMQEARRIGGAHARALIAALTSAFAIGQIGGPLCVSVLDSRPGGFALALLLASAVLAASAAALVWPRPSRAKATPTV